jgi:hypothetical protein
MSIVIGELRRWRITIPLTTVRGDYVLMNGQTVRKASRALISSWYSRPSTTRPPARWGGALVFALINDRWRHPAREFSFRGIRTTWRGHLGEHDLLYLARPFCWLRRYHRPHHCDVYYEYCVDCRKSLWRLRRDGPYPWSGPAEKVWRGRDVTAAR